MFGIRWRIVHIGGLVGFVCAACGGTQRWVDAPPRVTGTQTFVGCIGPTGHADRFILSVAQARSATYGDPRGTIVPQASPLPTVSPPPVKPRGSVGLPGDGPDAVTKIATYTLVGNGDMDMAAHLGHTVEITGDIQEIPEAHRASGDAKYLVRQLQVASARHISDRCLGDP